MKKLLASVLTMLFSLPVCSAILDVESMSISGGQVTLNTQSYQLLPGAIQPMVMGEYQGAPACCSPDAALTSLVYYEFGYFGYAGVHTSAIDDWSYTAPPPSGYVDTSDSTIHLDLSSWTWSWNGSNYLQGSSDIVGNYNVLTGAYEISWTSLLPGGPFSGYTHDWYLTGVATVSAVPLPAAAWLFGSGLIGLFAGLRRQKYS